MEKILENSLSQAVDYATYRQDIRELLAGVQYAEGVNADPLIHYTLLNETRMDRLEKTIKIDEKPIGQLNALSEKYTWLVISEGWCGDAAQILPVLFKMAESTPKIEMKIVFRDRDEALMDLFLTHGARSIPKVIVLDAQNRVVADWGPRPEGAVELIARHKAAKGLIDDEAKSELQLWYLHDKGRSTVNELVALMQRISA